MFPEKNGLTNEEVRERFEKYGPNVLPEQPLPSNFSVFFSQIKSPLVYILLVAGLITIMLRHIPDAVIIFLAVFINTVLGFIQEKKANNAFAALKKFATHHVEVIREGKRAKLDAAKLVPGDTVILAQGSKVPADGTLVFANRAYFDEAIITGESIPIAKGANEAVFMGTTVSAGQAQMKITATGAETKIGNIAQKIQEIERETPLKLQLANFSQKLVILVLFLIGFVFLIGIIRGQELAEMFTTAVALSVSSIPEGLVVSLTVVLAIGMQKILKREGLVKKLSSAETLGGVTTICVDKTGTLTEGKMQVVDFVGNKQDLARQMLLANDLDDPIVIAAFNWARKIIPDFIEKHPRLDSIPFSPQRKFFISLHKWNKDKNMVFVNGAPDVLLSACEMKKDQKDQILKRIEEITTQGRRVIGLAKKEVAKSTKKLSHHDAKDGLKWVGILAFYDPVRPSVAQALELAKKAGIKIKVITGDYPQTTTYVLNELRIHIDPKEIISGNDLENTSPDELAKKVNTLSMFARTSPEQKHKIIEALQKNGEVVAMMGDGVNDAPALHEADIGIVVSEASDVAKESADLILLDSNFATIVAAIEEGRAIFDNIRKVILYLLSDAFAEIFIVLGGILLGLPLPLTAVQIIWINLVSDGLPGLALTIDPKRKGIMDENPRPPAERLVNKWMIALGATVSIFAGSIVLATFFFIYKSTGNLELARSMAFFTLGLNSQIYVFSTRSLLVPFWKNHLFENKWLILAVFVGLLILFVPFLTPQTQAFFGVVPLDVSFMLISFALAIVVFMAIEAFKQTFHLLFHPNTR